MDWVYEFPDTVVKRSDLICEKDGYAMAFYKINLGLSEKEQDKLNNNQFEEDQYLERRQLITKAKSFGVNLRICVYCAFLE